MGTNGEESSKKAASLTSKKVTGEVEFWEVGYEDGEGNRFAILYGGYGLAWEDAEPERFEDLAMFSSVAFPGAAGITASRLAPH
jgi:hypothetical protein